MMTQRSHLIAWVFLAAVSLVLHLWGLEVRSFHSDEAIHAHAAYKLLHEGTYRYNPVYHGPLLYYMTAASYAFFGDSDFTARLPIALSGVSLLLIAACLRRSLGQWAAWWTGVLLTLSPSVLYYGRFLIMDILELLTASAALVCFYTVATRPTSRTWVWLGTWTALAVATKENAYVTAFLVVLVLALFASYHGWKTTFANVRHWFLQHRIGLATALQVFLLVVILLYTVFLRYPEDWSFTITAIRYWAGQHEIERVAGPWWYYLPRLTLYEFLPLLAASIWLWHRRQRLRPIEGFLGTFSLASVVMYAYLGEKVPWLIVHQIWGVFPLAGTQLARTFGPHGCWWSRTLAILGLGATVMTTLSANFFLDEITPRRQHVEALTYVQTTPEFRDVAKAGLEFARQTEEQPVAAVEGIGTWPLVWYWRHLPVWWSAVNKDVQPPLVITDLEKGQAVQLQLGPSYKRESLPLRAWWLMEAKQPSPFDLARYVLQRRPWAKIGASNVLVFRRTGSGDSRSRVGETPAALAAVLQIKDTQVLGEGWLVEPRGVTVAGDRVAVTDTALSHIVLFSAGNLAQTVGTQKQLRAPEAVAWGLHGDLYIADTWQHRILTLDLQTQASRTLFSLPDGWYGPRGIAVHQDGRVAISDTGHKRIAVADPTMPDVHIIGSAGPEPGKFDEPVGITWVGDHLLVADTGNHRLQLLDTTGQVQRIVPLPDAWPDYYSRPQVVAIQQNVWLATDLPNAGLWIIRDSQVHFIDLSTDGIQPSGLAWDEHTNTLYLSDLGGRLWQFQLTSNEAATNTMANQPLEQQPGPGKVETQSDLQQ